MKCLQTLYQRSALLFPSYSLSQERNRSNLQRKKSLQFLPLLPPGIVLGLGKSQFIFKSFRDLPENILIASSRFSIQCVTLRDIQLESQGFVGISNCITYNSSLSRIHTKSRSEAFRSRIYRRVME